MLLWMLTIGEAESRSHLLSHRAPAAAGMACSDLEFGHWIQSSTQATNAERSGQVIDRLSLY